ncbi:MAG: glycosyltransferase family 39 protein [Terriglobales bacterium]
MNRATNHTILSPFRVRVVLAVITILAAALRLHQLSAKSFWIDEGASFSFATMPWRPFLLTLWSYQGNMTLYYFLLRGWIHFGDSEFAIRSLSVLFGVLAIPAIYLLGERLFDRPTGLVAAALLSVHSFHIQWSQEARAYSLLTLLLVMAAYLLVCAMQSKEEKSTGYWIAFAVTAALSFYAHIFAVFVLTAFALAIAFPKPYRVQTRTVVMVALLFEHLIAPMALFVLLQHGGSQLAWLHRPALSDISEFVLLLTGQGGVFLVVIYISLAGVAFIYPAEGDNRDSDSEKEKEKKKAKWGLRLILLWLILPPLLTLAASPFKPLFSPRYMVLCVPALVLLASAGVTRLYNLPAPRRWAGVASFVLLMSLSGWGSYKYFANFAAENTDWRSAVHYILENQQQGDGVVIYSSHALCYLYYAGRAENQHKIATAPDVVYPPDPRRPVSRDEISSDTIGRQRVWLLLHDEQEKPDELAIIESTLAGEKFQPQEKRTFPGKILITVMRYDQAPSQK